MYKYKQALSIAIIAAAVGGCSPMPPMPPMDAAVEHTRYGADVTTRHDVPVTGRNWKCPSCYK